MIRDLRLDYQKIHACPKDCMLFWAENEKLESCKTCGTSRWKVVDNKNTSVENRDSSKEYKIPAKVLRYFPLKPRLERMFLCSDFSKSMVWHALARNKDGRLRHPSDAQGWNTWLVVLLNYNLPPWLIMKPENLILSIILQEEIIEILCQLEMISPPPPAFFDIMVHLPIHLCKEIEWGGTGALEVDVWNRKISVQTQILRSKQGQTRRIRYICIIYIYIYIYILLVDAYIINYANYVLS
ncbi:hypothetical protein DCAR_0934571 [Daucus carota subsp. sativus]|uniref:DUF4218 domain-containing protein n=1 Tax=Daucus carota subsp. sativus TaxID=79200 RepID=A0AAF1BEF6_DAUCS|nr:hypothetical protein DCAR_0934571 [Daucus carota subsp. sativus]